MRPKNRAKRRNRRKAMGRGSSKAGGNAVKAKTYALFHGSPKPILKNLILKRQEQTQAQVKSFCFSQIPKRPQMILVMNGCHPM